MSEPNSSAVIRLRGVRHNNLKNFDLDLPLHQLIVITGLSGSGKSSLAFDTLYAEGQRRYIETFSPYARQFFDRMDKPQVDSIEGIPPAIAIEQRNAVRSTRSTVGTMTEICDHMKVLWPHLAHLHCRGCGQPVRKDSPQSVWQTVIASPPSHQSHSSHKTTEPSEILITFDVPLSDKLPLAESLALISKQGYQRLLVKDEIVRLDDFQSATHRPSPLASSLTIIQDRLKLAPAARSRFVEACEQAYHFGKCRLAIHELGHQLSTINHQQFSNRLHCAACDIEYPDASPALFSFNHPLGACPTCKGFGRTITIDYDLAVPDRSLTLAQGAVKPWRTGTGAESQADLKKFCKARHVPMDVPFHQMSAEHQKWIIEGDKDYGIDEDHQWPRAWYGVKGYFRWLETKSYKMHVRVLLSRYRAYTKCPECEGARLKPDALLYFLTLSPSDGERAGVRGAPLSDYVIILKDNTRPQRNIRVAFGDTPLGPWRNITPPFTDKLTEGATSLKLGDDWLIYFDSYGTKSYGAVRTRDFQTFTNVSSEMTFPEGLKHGTVFTATKKDLDYLWKVSNSMVTNVGHKFVSKLFPAEIEQRLATIDAVAKRGPFQPTWESITNNFQTPKWYQDAKFGLFIHWGAYAVPAFGSEWYPRDMYVAGSKEFKHHVATYGPQSQFGYKEFFRSFKAEKFDATAWAKLFKEAGVKYVVPVAEHHDGFPMYDSDLTDWTAKKLGPQRDIIAEQAKAFRKAGIVVGASSHRAEHWFFFDGGMYFESDVRDPRFADLYGPAVNKRTSEAQAEPPTKEFLDDWLLRSCEIVDKYRPEVLYFDWWICQPVFQPYLKTFAAYYYNRGVEWKKQVAINFKEWEGISYPRGAGVFDMERGAAADIQPALWQTCTSVSRNSWGYITNHIYKDTGEIVDELVDVVSKNGTMLLNIGPKADGTIPEREQQMLREIGAWLKINGEAIYGTRPWIKFGEGPTQTAAGSFTDKAEKKAFTAEDFRFTTKGKTLYAIALAWPENRSLVVKSLAGMHPKRVELLGYKGKLQWEQTNEGLVIKLPEKAPSDFAVTLKISGLR